MESEINQANENNPETNAGEESISSFKPEPNFYSDRDFGDEDAHDLFEV